MNICIYLFLTSITVVLASVWKLPAPKTSRVFVNHTPALNHRVKRAQQFRIKLVYDKHIRSLPFFNELKTEMIEPAVKFWTDTLIPKKPNEDKYLFPRDCINGDRDDQNYCTGDCKETTTCGPISIPDEYLDVCRTTGVNGKETKGKPGKGLRNFDLLILFTDNNNLIRNFNTEAYSHFCSRQRNDDRPIIGMIHTGTRGKSPDKVYMVNLMKHEIAHILVFDYYHFEHFRHPNGTPIIPRSSNGEIVSNCDNNDCMDAYSDIIDSNRIHMQFSERNKTIKMFYLTTPNVKRQVQSYFSCNTINGAPLERLTLSHFNKKVFVNEIMTPHYTAKVAVSNLTLAAMEDSGWYIVNYRMAEPFEDLKNLGCDYFYKSCYEYINMKKSRNEDIKPYCVTGYTKLSCSEDRDYVLHCDLIENKQTSLYTIFNYFADKTLVSINKKTDFCPFYLNYKRCQNEKEHLKDITKNFRAQYFGRNSKCIETSGNIILAKKQVRKKSTYQGAGCYKVKCNETLRNFFIFVYDKSYQCSYEGQKVKFLKTQEQLTYYGTFLCPNYTEVCKNKEMSYINGNEKSIKLHHFIVAIAICAFYLFNY